MSTALDYTALRAADLAAPQQAEPRLAVATRDLGGVAVAVLAEAQATALLLQAMAERRHIKLAFCNANLVNIAADEAPLRRQLRDFLILPDGIGVELGSRLLYGAPFPANLNGTDFIPTLLGASQKPLRVALLGGRPGVAARAARQLALNHPQHSFTVISHGFYAPAEEPALLARMERLKADLVLVALGNPAQERLISGTLSGRHGTVVAGIGAFFDFLAGEVPRAPAAIRAAKIEWLYRLWQEPSRLWRRYVVGNPVFLARMLRQYRRGHGPE